jgi:hypothetical protein
LFPGLATDALVTDRVPVTPHALAQAYVLGRAPNTPGVALRSLLPLYLLANTNPAIIAAASSCIAGIACE